MLGLKIWVVQIFMTTEFLTRDILQNK
jgi:hypothetical protein